MTYTTKREHT